MYGSWQGKLNIDGKRVVKIKQQVGLEFNLKLTRHFSYTIIEYVLKSFFHFK